MALVKREDRKPWRYALAMLLLAPAVAGCASGGDSAPAATPRGSSGFSVGETFSSIFGSSPKASAPSVNGVAVAPPELDCPSVDIRQGASTLAVSNPDAGALGLRYQVTFTRTARECSRQGSMINIRVGVQGRVILGPAGTPGEVKVPLRYALVKEGIEPKTIYTKLYTISVPVPPNDNNVLYTHVDETMTVPMPPAAEYDDYVVYIGFDPDGAAAETRKKPAPKPQRPRRMPPQ